MEIIVDQSCNACFRTNFVDDRDVLRFVRLATSMEIRCEIQLSDQGLGLRGCGIDESVLECPGREAGESCHMNVEYPRIHDPLQTAPNQIP